MQMCVLELQQACAGQVPSGRHVALIPRKTFGETQALCATMRQSPVSGSQHPPSTHGLGEQETPELQIPFAQEDCLDCAHPVCGVQHAPIAHGFVVQEAA